MLLVIIPPQRIFHESSSKMLKYGASQHNSCSHTLPVQLAWSGFFLHLSQSPPKVCINDFPFLLLFITVDFVTLQNCFHYVRIFFVHSFFEQWNASMLLWKSQYLRYEWSQCALLCSLDMGTEPHIFWFQAYLCHIMWMVKLQITCELRGLPSFVQ